MNIEKQFLEGNIGNGLSNSEDIHEHIRAQENEDESQSDDGDSSGPNASPSTIPRTFQHRDGPQTGVKGVIADYKHSLHEQSRRREQQGIAARAAYAAESKRNIKDNGGYTMWTKEEPSKGDQGSESELDDLGLDEELVFEEYKQERLKQMNTDTSGNTTRIILGTLSTVSPEEYVEIVDQQAEAGVPVIVLLLGNGYVSERLLSFFSQLVGEYGHARFLCVQAEECGFTDPDIVPIVLGYKNGELEHNLVHVVDQLSDPVNFEKEDVKRLLDRVLNK
ncbi:hypothetical protein IW140_003023 [Coemansia sp. RSA 1813]|nr:hypothetical protein EV178_006084 [Coemansia sp. RSA 1646]KAJ1766908.1 hypothetical protein LPJ74_005645 [Coemansia sp. RSA 1843]KAJ2088989.1 hypothetical protein IW138_003830 [Coemansia sp. RSA 986]KAJ2210657.1 hypothetical protein EV179_006087 [Coemansia sp. RSA 487]KAJ2569469.1 hypothetical protein IW140_003023 [Coemansia sp. RSA 1813]